MGKVPIGSIRRYSSRDHIQCPCAAAELVCFDTEVPKHCNKQVAQGLIVIPVQGKMLTVLQTANADQDWKVLVVMRDGVTHHGFAALEPMSKSFRRRADS